MSSSASDDVAWRFEITNVAGVTAPLRRVEVVASVVPDVARGGVNLSEEGADALPVLLW